MTGGEKSTTINHFYEKLLKLKVRHSDLVTALSARIFLRSKRNLPRKASGGRIFFYLDLKFRPKRAGCWGSFGQQTKTFLGFRPLLAGGQGGSTGYSMAETCVACGKKTQRAVSMGVDGGRVRLGRREAGEEWACRVGVDV